MLHLLLASFTTASSGPPVFPLFKQCDPRWGSNEMGVPGSGPGEHDTVCHQGCAMSSLAMALNGYGIEVPTASGGAVAADPGSLNAWLAANRGYTCVDGDCNNLVLDATLKLSGGHVQLLGEWGGPCCGGTAAKPSIEDLQSGLAADGDGHLVFIAHVRDNHHFVLLTAWDAAVNAFAVRDAGFNISHYPYANMSDVLIYSVLPPKDVALSGELYPLFSQGDYRWASDMIATKTVGAVGCLMSSISVALNAHGVVIPDANLRGEDANPGTLNAWLKTHSGYTQNDLVESAVPALNPSHIEWSTRGMHTAADLTLAEVKVLLSSRTHAVIANVMKGGHFVLVVGTRTASSISAGGAETTLFVSDSGFLRNSYDLVTDVVGWRIFNMTHVQLAAQRRGRMVLGGHLTA